MTASPFSRAMRVYRWIIPERLCFININSVICDFDIVKRLYFRPRIAAKRADSMSSARSGWTPSGIRDVCAAAGIPDQSYFTKLFRKAYVMTPAQYRSGETQRGLETQ